MPSAGRLGDELVPHLRFDQHDHGRGDAVEGPADEPTEIQRVADDGQVLNSLRAWSMPVSVVAEMTNSRSGQRARQASTSPRMEFISPIETAWIHTRGRPGGSVGRNPRRWSQSRRYLPVLQRAIGDKRRKHRRRQQIAQVNDPTHGGIIAADPMQGKQPYASVCDALRLCCA